MEFILILLIVLNIALLVIFRLFKTYEIDTFQAIVFNYMTAVVVGSIALGKFPLNTQIVEQAWFPYSILLGVLFVIGFNILAKTVQVFGVTLTSIAQKMSLILTISFTIIYFSESLNFIGLLGILAAIASIILINIPKRGVNIKESSLKKLWYMLFLTFLISGLIESLLFYVEAMDISTGADIGFVVTLFGIAALIGLIVTIAGWMTRRMRFKWKHVIAGVALGIPNFFTIFLLLKLIDAGWEGSQIYPILNVSIILGAAIVGMTLFKEKLSKLQWIGFGLGLSCIVLIALSNTIS